MSSHQGHTSIPVDDAYDFKLQLASEMKGHFVGPMPPQEFLNKFIPAAEALPQISNDAFSAVPGSPDEHERDMYGPFINAISGFTSNAVAWDTSNSQNALNTAQLEHFSLKPDVSIYWKGNSPADKNRKKRTDFSLMEMHVEFKKSDAHDPFDDEAGRGPSSDNEGFEKNTHYGREIRGQITSYALAQLASQFRCFAFSLLITGKFARFIRWDRAGAIVSSRFDYTGDPLLLAKFLCGFSYSSPEERGIDTSVTLASFDSQADEARVRRILGLKKSVTLYRYAVPEDNQKERCKVFQHYYYGPMPPYPKLSLIGRCTRSLPVVDLSKKDDDKAHVYMKDAWRIDSPTIEKEGDIYRSLHAVNVPHIAPFECGDDVVGHGYQTQTQRFASSSWVCKPRKLTGHVHYRMVLGVVGRALTSFSSSKEYVTAVRDALIAHKHAFEDAHILHRDLSASNVIIGNSGYLIDWDLCKRLRPTIGPPGGTGDTDDSAHSPRRRDRTGTWQFMSAMILWDRSKVQGRVDDLESSLHVLCWVALRYVDNLMSNVARSKHLREVYDEVSFDGDVAWGGQHKRIYLRDGSYVPKELAFKKPSPLLQLLKDIADVFKWRYIEISEEQRQRDQVVMRLLNRVTSEEYEAVMANSLTHNSDSAMKKLGDASWLLKILDDALNKSMWPEDDKASLVWLPIDTNAPPVKQARQQSQAQSSEQARAASYGTSSQMSAASRSSNKRGRVESSHDGPVKRARDESLLN